MPPPQKRHTDWLIDTKTRLSTVDGREVEVWDFNHDGTDAATLSAWAKHFRNHYCLDAEIDKLRKDTGLSRAEYLIKYKFPDIKEKPGPSIRAGDFGEILIADFLEFMGGFWVPRTRYLDRVIRNESTKGSDVLGFKYVKEGSVSANDLLAIFETKTHFSGKKPTTRLQTAVNASAKDQRRKGESLNAVKQVLFNKKRDAEAYKVGRFQREVDHPFKESYGAVALVENSLYDAALMSATDCSKHKKADQLRLIVVRGDQMMTLVHALYERSSNEA
ncbi:MAG: DUF1837 domain-containing protein [Verrucomicrobiae bacterium]|nr:DUF1837 domain-containing protein [Verrucomicrobiae bacterium]